MKRKYEKICLKNKKISFLKISLTIIAFIISLKIHKVPALIPMILVFLYLFFNLEYFMNRKINKEIYEYLTGRKKFEYETIDITGRELIELIKIGIPANTYILFKNTLHTIESKNNKYFFLDFKEYKSLDEILEASISNIKIKNIDSVTIVSYAGLSPKESLTNKD